MNQRGFVVNHRPLEICTYSFAEFEVYAELVEVPLRTLKCFQLRQQNFADFAFKFSLIPSNNYLKTISKIHN